MEGVRARFDFIGAEIMLLREGVLFCSRVKFIFRERCDESITAFVTGNESLVH